MQMIDLDAAVSQRQFAMILNCSRESISQAAQDGILREGGSLGEWLQDMHKHRTESAAGRRGGPLDLVQERARLAKLQADRILMETKKERREVMHVAPIAELVGGAYSNVRTKVLGLPSNIKSLVSYLLPRDVDAIDILCRQILMDMATALLAPEVSSRIDTLERAAWGDIGIDLNETSNRRTRKKSSSKVASDKKARLEKHPANVARGDAVSPAGS